MDNYIQEVNARKESEEKERSALRSYEEIKKLVGESRWEDLTEYHYLAVTGSSQEHNVISMIKEKEEVELPLHKAVYRSQYKLAKVLLDFEFDSSLKDQCGRDCVDLAVGDPKMIELLKASGIQVETETNNKGPCKSISRQLENNGDDNLPKTFIDLIEEGNAHLLGIEARKRTPDELVELINTPAQDGDYPLHIAVRRNDLTLVLWLLDNKADLNASNRERLNPYMLAESLGYSHLLNSLRPF